MAKILISLLGTGKKAKGDTERNRYEVTDYELEGRLYRERSFLSSAIVEHYGIERIYFIGTAQSMWENVAEVYGASEELQLRLMEARESGKLDDTLLAPLDAAIDARLGAAGSHCFVVEDGEDEEELWSMFERFLSILDRVEAGDRLYFDITHLFRSVSVMSFIFAEFGRSYRGFEIGGVFYGMLKKDEPSKIVDVSVFFELLEWAKAIEEMENFASLDRLVALAEGKVEKNGYNALVRAQEAFSIANMSALFDAVERLGRHMEYLSENENRIIRLVAPKVAEFVNRLRKKRLSDFQFELAAFFGEKRRYALAYIALAEAVVSRVCEEEGYGIQSKEGRQQAKKSIYEGYDKSIPFGHPKKELVVLYDKQINKIRNNIAHQLENSKQAKQDIENFDRYLQRSKALLKEIYG